MYLEDSGAQFVGASEPSPLQLEAKALLESGWWNDYYSNNTSTRCDWPGITCNAGGSVTKIYMTGGLNGDKYLKLNFSSFPNLVRLVLRGTSLQGSIPSSLGLLTNLTHLDLSYNLFNGSIPQKLGNMRNLHVLSLGGNNFSGPILSSLCLLTNLTYLDLSSNQFSGFIPQKLGNLRNLHVLSLGGNNFSGPILSSLCLLTNLTYLDLSYNQFSGFIPQKLGNLRNLHVLSLGGNHFSGPIPSSLWLLTNLTHLDLSYNQFIGSVPQKLGNRRNLHVSLGGNNFSRPIPSSPFLPAKNKSIVTKLIVVVAISISLGFLIFGCFLLSRCMVKKTQSEPREVKNGNIFSIWNYDGHIAYEDMIEATEGFDIKYCIGTGGYGSVYRAELPCGKVVALKKLHRSEAKNPTFDMSFKNEVKVLTEIRHRNIIKLHGFCLHKQCMVLIYEYMERGSLFYVLSNDVEAIELDWSKRVNIIKGTAHALSYMHHECIPSIVHRDITSNNILLNNKLEGFVSDFGTAKFLDPDSSNQTLVAGTRGYIAPGELLLSCYN
jgi:hypothetical protein